MLTDRDLDSMRRIAIYNEDIRALIAEVDRLRALDAAAMAVIEAAQAVTSEGAVRDEILCYSMGWELLERLKVYRRPIEAAVEATP